LFGPGLGIIKPCLPPCAEGPPTGPNWIREIKHDGFRITARRDASGVRLITRNGNDLTSRFPLIETAVVALPAKSCRVDGEAIVCDETGLAVFDLMRGHRTIAGAVLCAFDLLELNGKDATQPDRKAQSVTGEAVARLSSEHCVERTHAAVLTNLPHRCGYGI
jgi:bifunctional non-homologous end joining protein LigD